jgi:hypothetical protein
VDTIFLFLHITGAAVVGLYIIFAIISLFRHQTTTYPLYAKSIAWAGVYQLITGLFLAWQTQGTLAAFCARVGVYLSMMLLIEVLLFYAMKKANVSAPASQVAWSLSLGTITVLTTGVYLLR